MIFMDIYMGIQELVYRKIQLLFRIKLLYETKFTDKNLNVTF